jgi:ribose transport system substrate-binding protein
LTKKNGSPKGILLHVTGNTGASPVIDEEKGLEDVFKGTPEIKIAASCDSKNSREGGRKCMEDLIQAFPPGKVDGVIFDNDDAAIGGIAALNAAGRTDLKGMLWGKDGTVDGLKAVLNGDLSLTVQTPPFFGAASVQTFEDWKAGKPVTPLVYVKKESFDAHTAEHKARAQQRIDELRKMGVGCC